jgi:hypothetical protein
MGPLLVRLSRLNPTTAFLVAGAVVLAGLLLPAPVGGVLLLLIAGGLAALLSLTWPQTHPRMRMTRVVILAVLGLLAITKLH